MKKYRKNWKIMKHIEKNKEQSWHTLKQIMKTMTNIEKHNEQYWKIMKTTEETMKTNENQTMKTLKEILRLHSQNTVS